MSDLRVFVNGEDVTASVRWPKIEMPEGPVSVTIGPHVFWVIDADGRESLRVEYEGITARSYVSIAQMWRNWRRAKARRERPAD